jgi:hypothetical protein
MPSIVRAEIIGNAYAVGDLHADTLGRLAVLLLAANFPPGASIEAYRPGRATWDLRATSIRAAAEALLVREGRGCDSPPITHPRPRRGRTCASQNRSEAAA